MYSLKDDIKSALDCGSLKWKIKELYWAFRYAFSRAVHGYDDREVFNFNEMLLLRMCKLFGEFKKYNVGAFVANPGPNGRVLDSKETDAIIDEFIGYLKYLTDEERDFKENSEYRRLYEECGRDAALEYQHLCLKKYNSIRHDFFVLLEQYFDQLWY
jgi:hypothetical protein